MKKLVLFLILSITGFAQHVDLAELNQIASIRLDQPVELIHTELDNNNVPVYSVYNGTSNGFVILAANRQVKPILAYSTQSLFDTINFSKKQ